jgi:predicted nucleic acid-binding protein
MILIDSNILLDLATEDSEWYSWSSAAVVAAGNSSELAIDPVIYAEASVRYASPIEFDSAFPPDFFRRMPLPYTAAFLAGKAHLKYRQRGGARTSTLPDFFIGAHAAVRGYKLLTRDPRRFRKYFPSVKLIAPTK